MTRRQLHAPPARILTVVLTYACFASLWIILSDRVVALLFQDPTVITRVSTLKGWVFVAITSILLFGLMRRLSGPSAAPVLPRGKLKPLLLPLGLLVIAIVALAGGVILDRFHEARSLEGERLTIIVDLKTRQVADWLSERESDARYLATSPYFAEDYRRWRAGDLSAARDRLTARLDDFRRTASFQGAALLDEHGGMLWNSIGVLEQSDPALLATVRQAVAARQVRHYGPYRDAAGHLHLDFIAPLEQAGSLPPVVVLHADPEVSLFRRLEEWPAPSASAEILLFRRDGDQVLYLTQLRHLQDTALRFRLPLTDARLLTARVLRGEIRPGEMATGFDYRGVPISGVARAVPGTDWFLLAKMDSSELFAEASSDALWVGMAALLTLFAALTGAFLFLQRQELSASLREQQAQTEKLRALNLLEAVAEGSGDAIFAKDSEGRYLLFNREAARITGKQPAEVLGRDDRAIFPPAEAELLMATGRQVLAENRTQTTEEVLTTTEGTRTFLATKGPLRDETGMVIGLFGVSRDITERKQAEQERERLQAQLLQAQKMESVGRLAGGVAHDFNNMLFVILGHVSLALERTDPAHPVHADLLVIRAAAQRSADITRQLLAFARRQTVAPRVVDLNEVVTAVLSMLRRLIGEDIDLLWRPHDGLWPVNVDPAQIDQILANLCVNARDAMAGAGKVTIETDNVAFDAAYCSDHPGFAPGEYVRLAVSDNGCGMDQEVQSHLFEPFFTTKEIGRGTGLGLATVYGIVKQNEGAINVYSEPGQGTTFRIYLRRSTAEVVAACAGPAAVPPGGHGELILLVEDEATILDLGGEMLKRLGYSVLAAGTPEEALRLAGEHGGSLRLLITDVVMPGMNGRELAQRLSAEKPGLGCLYMSGYTANVIAHHGVLDRGIRFIQKPFSEQELGWKVHEALKSSPGAGGDLTEAVLVRVLYVDDEPALLELIRRYLDRHGCCVSGFVEPAAALAIFRRDPGAFDFVVTDLAMPGMTGFALARELLAARADVPIVMTSGYVTPEDEQTARALGALALIQKPRTVEELGAALEQVFRAHLPAG